MESKVEAVLAGKNSSFVPEDMEEKDAMAAAASPTSIFAFLAPPLSLLLLRHVACLFAGHLLGLDGGLNPSAPAPASSSSSSTAAAACLGDEVEAAASEDRTEMVLEVRSRGFTPPPQPRSAPRESSIGAIGGVHH